MRRLALIGLLATGCAEGVQGLAQIRVTEELGDAGEVDAEGSMDAAPTDRAATPPAPLLWAPQQQTGAACLSQSWFFATGGGRGPYLWSVIDGALPPGARWSIDLRTRNLDVPPTIPGDYRFRVRVQSQGGAAVEHPVALSLRAGPLWEPTLLGEDLRSPEGLLLVDICGQQEDIEIPVPGGLRGPQRRGRWLIYTTQTVEGESTVWRMSVEGTRPKTETLPTLQEAQANLVSDDGHVAMRKLGLVRLVGPDGSFGTVEIPGELYPFEARAFPNEPRRFVLSYLSPTNGVIDGLVELTGLGTPPNVRWTDEGSIRFVADGPIGIRRLEGVEIRSFDLELRGFVEGAGLSNVSSDLRWFAQMLAPSTLRIGELREGGVLERLATDAVRLQRPQWGSRTGFGWADTESGERIAWIIRTDGSLVFGFAPLRDARRRLRVPRFDAEGLMVGTQPTHEAARDFEEAYGGSMLRFRLSGGGLSIAAGGQQLFQSPLDESWFVKEGRAGVVCSSRQRRTLVWRYDGEQGFRTIRDIPAWCIPVASRN